MFTIQPYETHCTFDVHVTAKAKQTSIGGHFDGALKVSVTAPADKGKANQAVIKLIAKTLKVAKSRVEVLRGKTSRRKTIAVHEAVPSDLDVLRNLFS
ncbi:hypothetical protein Q31b_38510 [Novipirellula aureliae]|uniref:UPF0235 protein Q31b_38510 n=1 Tax=Novipirellula aureliae TaxID=2527966 RepID=A0A5C6DNB8_9BACT|nr:DUF167 domain-containing protein [Novipirellula aureliae]TWU38773.1 hypothetical protein Q31b_38510 [Novipirellula aureliae]